MKKERISKVKRGCLKSLSRRGLHGRLLKRERKSGRKNGIFILGLSASAITRINSQHLPQTKSLPESCLELLYSDHRMEKYRPDEQRRSKIRLIFRRIFRSRRSELQLLDQISLNIFGQNCGKRGKRADFVLSLLRLITPPPDFCLDSRKLEEREQKYSEFLTKEFDQRRCGAPVMNSFAIYSIFSAPD